LDRIVDKVLSSPNKVLQVIGCFLIERCLTAYWADIFSNKKLMIGELTNCKPKQLSRFNYVLRVEMVEQFYMPFDEIIQCMYC
jgi:hypothetical protein